LLFGNVAHAAVFTNALSAAQVQTLYKVGIAPDSINLQASSGYGRINLNWTAVTGATNYIVARSTSSGTETTIGTTASLNYSDTGLANGTTYYYVVTPVNAQGLIRVSSEVSAMPATLAAGSYTAAILSNNPVAFWELNETGDPASGTVTAYDYAGGFNGTYGTAAKNGNAAYNVAGPQSPTYPGFPTNNTAVQTMRVANSGVTVPALGLANTNATILAWIYPTNNQAASSAIFANRTSGTTAGFGYRGTLVNGAYPLGYMWNDNDPATYGWTGSSVVPPVNQWSMVALTITASNAIIYCWSPAGVQQGTFIYAHNNMTFNGTSQIGNDASAASKNFLGIIDDVAVFNDDLSSNALQSLYVVGANRAPVFLSNPFTMTSVMAGQPYGGTVAANASDPNGDPIMFGKVSGPGWLTVASNGGLGGSAVSSNVGTNSFVVSVMDTGGLSNTATMNLVVTPAPAIVTGAAMQLDGSLMLNWGGGVGPYQVQWTTNLSNPNWQNLGAPVGASNLLILPTNGTGFYRIYGQ
jgi:Concanavalin A-like lectin/glucanases superfamily